jgi:Tol biopolymer transport system component
MKQTLILLFCALSVLFVDNTFADITRRSTDVWGEIIDANSVPIRGVEVQLAGQSFKTGDDGIYFFHGISFGIQNLEVVYGTLRLQRQFDVASNTTRLPPFVIKAASTPKIFKDPLLGQGQLIRVVGTVSYGSLSNDGQLLVAEVFADETRWFDIWSINVETSEVDILVSTPDLDENPRLSPDGRFVVFHRVKPGEQRDSQKEVWMKDIETGELRKIDKGFAPPWYPDGQWFVYGKWVRGDPDIYRVALTGGTPDRLTADSARDIYPYWGILGGVETIVFSSSRADPNLRIYDIWAMNPDGSNKRRLSTAGIETGNRMFGPAISPDGELVVFWEYDKKRGHSVWIVDHEGRNQRRLLRDAANPNWDPNAKKPLRVYFGAKVTGRTQIWRIKIPSNKLEN